ncbi:hypothetical protein J3R30DRAFT_3659981 [Lentinula aciculospora]|uniref:Serine/threonine-protein phosphatase 1 regulatory subunit 10 n=1 Tax=Lentinula aciculospora TaxID=153920 RepID=A0A9W9A2F6_9AGAR|nr:hypothetical protein J3R30DRAFT_3659981 [Lentinula aciculospora]
MEQTNFYTPWLTPQPGQSSSSSSFDDWPKERPTTTSHASTTPTPALGEINDIFTELGAPSSASTNSLFAPHNYYVQAPYNSMPYGASWTPSSTSTSVPVSSYSSLNGATSSAAHSSSTQMIIDPALTSMGGPSSQSTPQPPRPYSQPLSHASPPQHASLSTQQPPQQNPPQQPFPFSSFHNQQSPPQLHLQQQQQTQQLPQGTLSPQSLHPPSAFTVPANSFYAQPSSHSPIRTMVSTPNAPSSTPTMSSSQLTPPPVLTAAEKRAQLYALIKPMLQASSFTGAGAVQALAQRLDDFGATEVDAPLRMEVLTKIRDGAGNHYFRAWGENAITLEITREWLKQSYSAKQDNPLAETTMPLLHIIDRLPLTVDSLKTSKLGKLVVKLVKDPPTPAIKDMASNIERRWRQLVDGASSKITDSASNPAFIPDVKPKKRKLEAPIKAPTLSKKPAVGSAMSTKPIAVKKEAVSSKPPPIKDAKSDSSFFSAPKAKPKLPSFKKAPLPASGNSFTSGAGKKELDHNIAQPSSIDPFQEVLKSMAKGRRGSPATGASASATPPPAGTPTFAGQSGLTKLGKKKKSVTWAPDGSLEAIKFIEPAVYDDEPVDGIHLNLRDLDRGEGAALHAHLFEETVDWFEPLPIEIPIDIDYPPRGEQSEEKAIQERREQTVLSALYMTEAQIPDTPTETTNTLPEEVDKDVVIMTSGPDVDSVFWSSEASAAPSALFGGAVADILSQLTTGNFALANGNGSTGGGTGGINGGMPILGQGHGHDMMMTLSSVDPLSVQSLPPEQLQVLLQQLNPAYVNDQSWQNSGTANHYSQFGYGEDNSNEPARWAEGRGRGRGRGKGRGGRGEDGFRHNKRKPCSFFQSGRCKYGDQCDFAHEIIS